MRQLTYLSLLLGHQHYHSCKKIPFQQSPKLALAFLIHRPMTANSGKPEKMVIETDVPEILVL